jgi:hypothetical protein
MTWMNMKSWRIGDLPFETILAGVTVGAEVTSDSM